MSPTKAYLIITTYRKVSVTDQTFYRWPGFNDPTMWRTFSSTVNTDQWRLSPRPLLLNDRPLPHAGRALSKEQWDTCAFYDAPNPALHREWHCSTTEAKERGPRSVACHSFKGVQWLSYTILLQAPLAIFYCCLVLCFHPTCCSCYQRSIHTTWTTTHSWCSVWRLCSHNAHICHHKFWFVLCYVIQMLQKQSSLTYDNIILGQRVAFCATFYKSFCYLTFFLWRSIAKARNNTDNSWNIQVYSCNPLINGSDLQNRHPKD